MEATVLCFAYGSNMSLVRLKDRVPSARFVGVGTLVGHRLAFHKISKKDGSGKCDAQYTGSQEDKVIGVVFEISDVEKPKLDKAEGLRAGYDEKQVEVAAGGKLLNVQMYFATDIDATLKPYHWYKKHVMIGATENGLPLDYVAKIEAVESEEDPDPQRAASELSIYR